jgi:hypothetical protein
MLELSESIDTTLTEQQESLINFAKQVISNIFQKLNRFSSQWERLQKEQQQSSRSPFRLLSALYDHHFTIPTGSSTHHEDNSISNTNMAPEAPKVEPSPSSGSQSVSSETPTFAQRYVDEIAPLKKLREYEDLACKQKEKLLREAVGLHRSFSAQLSASLHMERSVQSISSLAMDFAAMIESQSDVVQEVEGIAKEVAQSVQRTDEELLLALERTQRQQWSMLALMCCLSLLLLLLHVLTP